MMMLAIYYRLERMFMRGIVNDQFSQRRICCL
jgi:hypothetical protein